MSCRCCEREERAYFKTMAADTPRVRAAMRSLCHELDGQRPGLASLVANALELSLAMRGASSLPPSCTASLPADEDAAGLTAALAQLSEFAGSFEAKVARSVVEPLQSLQASADAATRLARAFDDESEALDAAQRGYLGLSRDSPLEARAAALQEVHAHRASVSVSLMSAGAALREARGAAAWAPRRAVAQLLVAQLAFHQSCARVLAAQVPRLSAMIQVGGGGGHSGCGLGA
jgi:Arf-GAP/coiled-coil/ANK repeat/PH domain-containing protein